MNTNRLGGRFNGHRAMALAAAVGACALGCGSHPVAPPQPPYAPTYTYKAAAATAPTDVTIAVIAPALNGVVQGEDGDAMMRALEPALLELVTAKGMKYRGPFPAKPVGTTELTKKQTCRESIADMTFPDKKGSDLVLCLEMQVVTGWEPVSAVPTGQPSPSMGSTIYLATCDVKVSYAGRIDFLALEPLSGEVMWRKSVSLEPKPDAPTTYHVRGLHGPICYGQTSAGAGGPMAAQPSYLTGEPSPDLEVGNQYRRGLERLFWETMHGIDTYMSAEEFTILKGQAQDLRNRKVY